jgi:hypothetical protein
MGKLIFLLLLLAGGFYAYEHYFGEKTAPPRLAPADTVYTLARTNASGDGQLIGIPAGSKLRLVAKSEGVSTVEYRGLEFDLPETFLTRDLDAVEQIRADTAGATSPPRPDQQVQPGPQSAPNPDPEVIKLQRVALAARDKRVNLEHRLNRVRLTRQEKGDFDGMTDLRTATAELEKQIERLHIEEQRLNELINRKTR